MPNADEIAAPVTITVRENGPLLIKGNVTLLDEDGNPFPLEAGRPFKLCRCGLSKTKPFCDITHRDAGFVSTERAGEITAP